MKELQLLAQNNSFLEKEIYVHHLNTEIKRILTHLKHPTKITKQLNIKYTKLKEWPTGRKPISLYELKQILDLCSGEFKKSVKKEIESKEIKISCKYSSHKIRIPKQISKDLAYAIGLILGDGHVAGDSLNKKGNWIISVYFDNKEHLSLYSKIIEQEFEIICKYRLHKENCFQSYFGSKGLHWFFRVFFELHNGYKAHKIEIPKLILKSRKEIIASLIQGLFDSDGTITKGNIRYSTVSRIMAEQVQQELNKMKINTSTNVWIKNQQYKPLYTVSVISKKCKELFAKKIGFRHPIKKALLRQFIQ